MTYLDNKGVDIDLILEDYFNNKAPFESNIAKKHEFPDAFIISKLKKEFNKDNPVWVISSDKGFIRAINEYDGFNFLYSIKEFLDKINKRDDMYNTIVKQIRDKNLQREVHNSIKEEIESDYIEVDGLECDRKGYCEGYEYEDSEICNILIKDFHLSSVDEINEGKVYLTVSCEAEISVYCKYYNYDNAIWDFEDEKYIYLDEGRVYEEHEPEFECNLIFSISNNDELSLSKLSYNLVLNQDSRINREFIEPEDPSIEAEAEMMDALENYHNH